MRYDQDTLRKSSGWLREASYVIRMTWYICHKSSGWYNLILIPKSFGWLSYSQYLIQMTDAHCRMSSRWLTWRWYLIRMSYGKFIMSIRWHTLPSYVMRMTELRLGSHRDELRQCYYVIQMRYASFLKSSVWDSKFDFCNTRWNKRDDQSSFFQYSLVN